MGKCTWCKRRCDDSELNNYTDELGQSYNICSSCFENVTNNKCRSCGNDISGFSIEGKCYICAQNAHADKHQGDNEVIDGLLGELDTVTDADRELARKAYKAYVEDEMGYEVPDYTEEEFEKLQLVGTQVSPRYMLNNTPNAKQWRYIWAFVKLNNGSIKRNNNLIHKYFPIIDQLLVKNTDLLRDNTKVGLACKPCHIVICETAEDRKALKQGEIIAADAENGVYIMKGLGSVVKD